MSDTIEKGKTEDELRRAIEERNHLYSLLEKLSEELTGVPVGIGTEAELLEAIRAMKRGDTAALLEEIEAFLDDRADADHDGSSFVPNEAMRLLVQVRAALNHAEAMSNEPESCKHGASRPWGNRGFRECLDCGHIWDPDEPAEEARDAEAQG